MAERATPGQSAAFENSPLLASPSTRGDGQASGTPNVASGNADVEIAAQIISRPAEQPKHILVVTCMSLVLSAVGTVGFVAAFASAALLASDERPRLGYWMQYSAQWDTIMCVLAVFVASFNLRLLYRENRPMWLGPNLFVDMAVAAFLSIRTIGLLTDGTNWAFCSLPYHYPPQPPTYKDQERYAACKPKAVIINALLGVAFGSSLILAFVHLCLAINRWITVFRNRQRETNGVTRFRIPSGQLSFEFTIKFLRQEETRTGTVAATARV